MNLFFFDVDGTLLDVRHKIHRVSPAVKAAIQRLRERGDGIIISTGRSYSTLPETILDLKPMGLNLNAGSYVLLEGKEIRNVHFSQETLDFILHRFADHKTVLLLEAGKISYSNQYDSELGQELLDIFNLKPDCFEPLKDTQGLRVNSIGVTFLDQETPRMLEDFDEHGVKVLPQPLKHSYDVTVLGSTKQQGMEAIIEQVDLQGGKVYAFGDSYNDMEMLAFADVGVAMGDAPDEVKEKADLVTDSCMDDGIAKALEKLGF